MKNLSEKNVSALTVRDALTLLDAGQEGLSGEEAAKRLSKNGKNLMPTQKPKTFAARFFSQFCDLLIVILLAAAVLSFVTALISGDGQDLAEPLIIVFIVAANAFLGAVQEHKAEKTLRALQNLVAPETTVLRNGLATKIATSDLCVGDVVCFSGGDAIGADCRILECVSLKVNEASLSGEALPVEKHAAPVSADALLHDRKNMLFAGCFVLTGKCKAVVSAVGANTEIGKIAGKLSETADEKTPLQRKLKKLSQIIGYVCIAVCVAVFVWGFVGALKNTSGNLTEVFLDVFMMAVSFAVAAVPEGLPAVVTVVLSRGVFTMAQNSAVVKRLPAVETLGCATVICSDKTGTLTENKLKLEHVVTTDGKFSVSDTSMSAKDLLTKAFWCCCVGKNGNEVCGDPVDVAISLAADKAGIKKDVKTLWEIPFDSDRKKMTVVVVSNNEVFAVTKGAYEKMIDGEGVFSKQYDSLCRRGYRVLAVSAKEISAVFDRTHLEDDCRVVGLLAFSDPPRKGVKQSVQLCILAGIRPVMITGDSVETAAETARTLGILQNGKIAVSGAEFFALKFDEQMKLLPSVACFARVSPLDKLKIVECYKRRGEVVAMTGDGVNDAPALKRADIGCAMGSGTEVAKNAADMILLNDDFSSVVKAVEIGRSVFDNIKKTVRYLVGCNLGEVFAVFAALLLFGSSPLNAIQLLWINLVTDCLPAIALGLLPPERNVMNRPPLRQSDDLFSSGEWRALVLFGLVLGGVSTLAYKLGLSDGVAVAQTAAFLTISLAELFYVLRAKGVLFPSAFFAFSWVASFAMVVLAAFPFASLFSLVVLNLKGYVLCVALALAPTLFAFALTLLMRLGQKAKSGVFI